MTPDQVRKGSRWVNLRTMEVVTIERVEPCRIWTKERRTPIDRSVFRGNFVSSDELES